MSVTSEKFKEELLNIEIAIELDSGKSIPEIAEKFAVKLAAVKAVAKKTGFTEQKITKTKNLKTTWIFRKI